MRLGSFWGLTAPMFILAFPERESPLPIFSTMAESANKSCLHDLQVELMNLQKINKFISYSKELKITEAVSMDSTWHDGMFDDEQSDAIARLFEDDVKRLCIAKIFEKEKLGKILDLTNFDVIVHNALYKWTGNLKQVDKLILSIVSSFKQAQSSMLDEAIASCTIPPDTVIGDRIILNGKNYTLSDNDKAVISYFVSRLPDVAYWIEQLNISETEQEEVFGTNFFNLIRRNPKALKSIVYNMVTTAAKQGNTQIFKQCMQRIHHDVIHFRENCEKFVHVDFIANGAETDYRMSKEAEQFFSSLNGYERSELRESDLRILEQLFECVSKLTPEFLSNVFGYSCNDWNSEGERLSTFSICGINECQMQLFREAVLNTVLSYDTVYCDKEYIETIFNILENDILPLVETTIPIGEALNG